MDKVNPVYLSRALIMDLPAVCMQEVFNGFGRYIRRLEKFLTANGYDVRQAVKTSVKEMKPQTIDGRRW